MNITGKNTVIRKINKNILIILKKIKKAENCVQNAEKIMTDVHSHIIQELDDGSPSLETSLKLIEEEIKQGVTDIICTPHYRFGLFESSGETVLSKFDEIKKAALKLFPNLNLYCGREIYYSEESYKLIKNKQIETLNGTKYLLMEFPFFSETDIDEICYNIGVFGYTPVIAHIERYVYFRDVNLVSSVKKNGAMIQINAGTICGASGNALRKFAFKLMKNDLIDFIGSDLHYGRTCYMAEAYEKVSKKFGGIYAEKIFNLNARKLLLGNLS